MCSKSNGRAILGAWGRVGARDEKRGGESSSAAAILDRARQLPRSHRQTPRPPLSPDPVVRTTPGPLSPTPLPFRAAIAIAPGPGAREKGGGRSPPPPVAIRSSAAAPAPVVRASGSTGPDPFPPPPGAVERLTRCPCPSDTASCRDTVAPAPAGRSGSWRDAGSGKVGHSRPPSRPCAPHLSPLPPPRPSASPGVRPRLLPRVASAYGPRV